MTPNQAIDMLDRALRRNGEWVTLQRSVGKNQGWLTVNCRAMVRGFQAKELSVAPGSGIVLGDTKVTMSPTQINEAQWPGGYVVGATTGGDQRVPDPNKNDRLIVAGRTRRVVSASPTYIGDCLVRLDLVVR
jgi:hypothetical protein